MKRYSFIKLLEKTDVGVLQKKINIVMDVDKTDHAIERQSRHEDETGKVITDKEIKATIDAALPKIVNQLLQNMINVGHKIIIKNTKSSLNVVVKLKGNASHPNEIDCEVITVMVLAKKFGTKSKTPVIKVSV